MLSLALFCLLVSSTIGTVVKDGAIEKLTIETDDTVGMKMCCMPPQWEGDVVELNSPGKSLSVLHFAHDDATLTEGYYAMTVGGSKPIMQVFKDFKNNWIYTVNMTTANYTCTKTVNTEHFFYGCMDKDQTISNIQYLGDAFIGPMTGSNVHHDAWSFHVGIYNADVNLSLSREGCIPIVETIKSSFGTNILMYNNMNPMVKTKDLLTIPAACSK